MSKLFFVALLFYNIANIRCMLPEIYGNLHGDRPPQSNFLLEPLTEVFMEKEADSKNNVDGSTENWRGSWMPHRPGDPTPPPKVWPAGNSSPATSNLDLASLTKAFTDKNEDSKNYINNDTNNWTGKWMPDRPGDPTPPPKVWSAGDSSLAESNSDLASLTKAFTDKGRDSKNYINSDMTNWMGKWMPDRLGDPTPLPKVWPAVNSNRSHSHSIPMGKISNCDDGETNLSVDWDYSPVNYTCYGHAITPSIYINAEIYSEHVPTEYTPQHKCMNESINYHEAIPLYGTHRPSWPVYGEYKFLPKQRWLHSLEHGAVVMLYHPCGNLQEIELLKSLVKNCLRRHIISPYNLVNKHRPLVLVTWGSRLSMSYVNPVVVKKFIQKTARRGPEYIPRNGNFKEGLLSESRTVSDAGDSNLCPNI